MGPKLRTLARVLPLLAILFVSSARPIVALDPTSHISQYGHRVWRLQDGYFGGRPRHVAQTTDGYIWVGSNNGLFKFDGVRFVRWNAQSGEELPSSSIRNEEGASLDFSVVPAYYQTAWFRALCLGAFLGLLLGAYRVRVRQLRQKEKNLRDVIDTMPALAWSALPDGTDDFVNRHWHEYTGLSVEESVGTGWQGAVHPADLKLHLENWRTSLATGEPFQSEVRYRRADGQYRWFLSRAVPMRDKHGKILKWFGISTDIEDRKCAEQEREQLRADLAHVNRVNTMGELTASLAHEIKQPIAASVINAETCLEWLKHERPALEEIERAATNIVEAGKRASGIIDRLRALYKKAPQQRELVDVNETITEMISLLPGEARRSGVSTKADLATDIPKIIADRVQLQQVLMNVMLNGIEAMKDTGGILTMKSELGQGGRLLISISDTGVGLPTDKTERIFEAFFTTKPQGSGMGLAISRSIIESHGGNLWATPNSGAGATFHFTLPIEEGQCDRSASTSVIH